MTREGAHGHATRSLLLLLEAYAGNALPEWHVFASTLKLIPLEPNEVLCRAGEIQPYLYLVHTGLLRVQGTTPRGHTSTIFFSEEGDVVASMTALSPQAVHRVYDRGLHPREADLRPAVEGRSLHTISAVERSVVLRADYRLIERLARRHHAWGQMAASFCVLYAMTLQTDLIWSRDTPEERYRSMLRDRPDLLSRLTQRDLAAFLNVTEVTMCRIAKRVRQEDERAVAVPEETVALS